MKSTVSDGAHGREEADFIERSADHPIREGKLASFLLIVTFAIVAVLIIKTPDYLQAAETDRTETYIYDAAGRLTQVFYSDGTTIRYTYDANSNIVSIKTTREEVLFLDGFEP